MNLLNSSLDWLIVLASNIVIYGLVAYIVIQVLIQFEIIPRHNQQARAVWGRLAAIYEPVLRPVRRQLPLLGGFDLSPMVLIFSLYFLEGALRWLL